MIARLSGTIVDRAPGRIVLDVRGVGYEVLISLQTQAVLPLEGDVTLEVHTHVREAEITLYGFLHPQEKTLFALLQTVAGIGPRVALGILSGLPATRVAVALRDRDLARLISLPGVGRRTAERMITDLSERCQGLLESWGEAGGPGDPVAALRQDARLALVQLGYAESIVDRTLDQVLIADGPPGAPLEEILRRSLRHLARA
jgi:Holliday junction DNA helicase RuvA